MIEILVKKRIRTGASWKKKKKDDGRRTIEEKKEKVMDLSH